MKKTKFITLNKKEIEEHQNSFFGLVPICKVQINDVPKRQFTDIFLSVKIANGKAIFMMEHEKGYPSENKGFIVKKITAKWISTILPKEKL